MANEETRTVLLPHGCAPPPGGVVSIMFEDGTRETLLIVAVDSGGAHAIAASEIFQEGETA